jgi:hypothetical protein
MRIVSTAFRAAIAASATDEIPIVLVDITHPELEEPRRIANDVASYIYGGNLYVGFPYELEQLGDADTPPKGHFRMQNIDRQIGNFLQTLPSSPRIKITCLAASEFDETRIDSGQVDARGNAIMARPAIGTPTVQYSADHLRLVNVKGDIVAVEGDLASYDLSTEPWPAIRATQDRLPGLFR